MFKKILIPLSLLIVVIGIYAAYLFNKKVPTLEKSKPDYVIVANDLFDEFDSDEESANLKYVDKILEVSGEVVGIHNDSNDSLWSVFLKAENAMMYGINCSFSSNPNPIEIGETVVVKGQCVGKLEDVLLKNCLVLK